MTGLYDDHGIRFEYPPDWDVEVVEDGPRTTVSLQLPESTAFALIALDTERPDPSAITDEALDAMRENYPDLEATPALDSIDGRRAVGFNVEFFCLDVITSCSIRTFRTAKRTIMIFLQWAEIESAEVEFQLSSVCANVVETEGIEE